MKNAKLFDILFRIGLIIIALGVLSGAAVGVLTADGFNLVPAIIIWLLSLITGTGVMNISGTLTDAHEKKQKDEEMLRLIIEKVKNEENS